MNFSLNTQHMNQREIIIWKLAVGAFWRFLRGNQKPKTQEVQTIQKTKEKGQKDKQRSTKHYTENYRSSNMNPT